MVMDTLRVRRAAASVVGAGLLVALAACGGASGGGKAGAHPSTAVDTASAPLTAGAPPAIRALQVAERRTIDMGSVKVAGLVHDGIYATDKLKGSLNWHDAPRADMAFTFTGGPVLASMRKGGMGDTGLARYLPDAFYTGSPVLTPWQRGRHWGRYTWAEVATPYRHQVALLKEQVEASSPVWVLGALLTSANVHQAGTQTVRGQVLTGYEGTVTATRLAGPAAAGFNGGVRPWLTETGMKSGTFAVWVSADGLPDSASVRGEFNDGAYVAALYWSDYGVPVHVSAPPAADTWTSADRTRLGAKTAGS
jgi:hypothetical protein